MSSEYHVDPRIEHAHTLPPAFYRDVQAHERLVERAFARTWHYVADATDLAPRVTALPVTLAPGCLDEPLLLTRTPDARVRCLSNVCTHRGAILLHEPSSARELRCPYHGRRFSLEGRFVSMPEFEAACDFPSSADDLGAAQHGALGPLHFAALSPALDFESFVAPMRERVSFFDWSRLEREPGADREYVVEAHWATYLENYLEGFHVPYVHPGLNRVLDYAAYGGELYAHGNLQIGVGARDAAVFEPPAAHPDHGARVAAYYFWLFPGLMFNLYPWGLSLNLVTPLSTGATRITFRRWVSDSARLGERGAGADLDTVEVEDQQIVASVARGLRSRSYRGGRFSPSRERGVHQLQRLIAACLA